MPCEMKCPGCNMATDARQLAGTPRGLFEELHREYEFTVDVCACPFNAKLDRYVVREDNALDLSWAWPTERVFCNPPYIIIPPWLEKRHEPELAAYLLPARTDRLWWRLKVEGECHYFVGEKPETRVQFEPPPGVEYSSNPDCSVLLLFGKGIVPGGEAWRSGKTGKRL